MPMSAARSLLGAAGRGVTPSACCARCAVPCPLPACAQYEFMQLSEQLGAQPVWVLPVGISQTESASPEELDTWIKVRVQRGAACLGLRALSTAQEAGKSAGQGVAGVVELCTGRRHCTARSSLLQRLVCCCLPVVLPAAMVVVRAGCVGLVGVHPRQRHQHVSAVLVQPRVTAQVDWTRLAPGRNGRTHGTAQRCSGPCRPRRRDAGLCAGPGRVLRALCVCVHGACRWGTVRASMGRPQPWALRYVTLGNEQCRRPWYAQHFARISAAVLGAYPALQVRRAIAMRHSRQGSRARVRGHASGYGGIGGPRTSAPSSLYGVGRRFGLATSRRLPPARHAPCLAPPGGAGRQRATGPGGGGVVVAAAAVAPQILSNCDLGDAAGSGTNAWELHLYKSPAELFQLRTLIDDYEVGGWGWGGGPLNGREESRGGGAGERPWDWGLRDRERLCHSVAERAVDEGGGQGLVLGHLWDSAGGGPGASGQGPGAPPGAGDVISVCVRPWRGVGAPAQGRLPVAVTEYAALGDGQLQNAVAEAGFISAFENQCTKVRALGWGLGRARPWLGLRAWGEKQCGGAREEWGGAGAGRKPAAAVRRSQPPRSAAGRGRTGGACAQRAAR